MSYTKNYLYDLIDVGLATINEASGDITITDNRFDPAHEDFDPVLVQEWQAPPHAYDHFIDRRGGVTADGQTFLSREDSQGRFV